MRAAIFLDICSETSDKLCKAVNSDSLNSTYVSTKETSPILLILFKIVTHSFKSNQEVNHSKLEVRELIGILQFAQGGVKALENFRMQSEDNTDIESK